MRKIAAQEGALPEILIRPAPRWPGLRVGELWDHRELLAFFVWRDLKVRYKQTVLGAAWAILQPLLTMAVFSVIFGRLARIPSDGLPYPVFVFAALLPWQLFAASVSESAGSLVTHQQLITKVAFPRLLLPLSAVTAALVDFAVALLALAGLMVYYGIAPTAAIAALPLFLMLAMISALGVGTLLSALNVRFRDVRYTIPFLVQIWLFATPIAYPASLVPDRWRAVYGLNPMAGAVEGFRWALLGQVGQVGSLWLGSALGAIVLLVAGVVYFRRVERHFADVV